MEFEPESPFDWKITCKDGKVLKIDPLLWSITGNVSRDMELEFQLNFPEFHSSHVKIVIDYIYHHTTRIKDFYVELRAVWKVADHMNIDSLSDQLWTYIHEKFPDITVPYTEGQRKRATTVRVVMEPDESSSSSEDTEDLDQDLNPEKLQKVIDKIQAVQQM